jgi:hypothetical protein
MSDGGPFYDIVVAALAARDTVIAGNTTNIGTNSTNIQSTIDQLYQGYKNVGTTGHTPSDLNTVVAASINARITALEGGGTLTQYTTSATWTNPTPAAHNLITVVCINGGQGGGKGGSTSLNPGLGGQAGGYISKQFYTDALPSTVAMTIGAGTAGATSEGNATIGGTTSFGSYLTGTAGVGAIFKADGSYSTSVPPGNGGNGGERTAGTAGYSEMLPTAGLGSAFAAGGWPVAGGVGGNGAAAPSGVPSGGGGGGGGGPDSSSNAGGAGGSPGGAGGGGNAYGSSSFGNGGAGAAGCIYTVT